MSMGYSTSLQGLCVLSAAAALFSPIAAQQLDPQWVAARYLEGQAEQSRR